MLNCRMIVRLTLILRLKLTGVEAIEELMEYWKDNLVVITNDYEVNLR